MDTEAQRGIVGLGVLQYMDIFTDNSKDPQRGRLGLKVNLGVLSHGFLDPIHAKDMLVPDDSRKAVIENVIESENNSQEQSMQSTMNETMQTGKATNQTSSGSQNDYHAKNNSTILCNSQARNSDTDANLENIPVEFWDPFVLTLMEDPVVLPSNKRMDRAVIKNHISMFHIDPFSGNYLTEDMLVSDNHLRKRIREFISSSQGQGMQSTSKETLQIGTASYQSPVAQNYSDPNKNTNTVLRTRIEEFISYSQGQGMQSTSKETLRIGTASYQSPVAQNYSHPNRNTNSIPKAKFDVDVSHVKIPKEFLDPFCGKLLEDPVVLPSGYRLERTDICEHICDFPYDPFSGRYLTENMLHSDGELRSRIEEFISSLEGKSTQSTSKETLQTGTATYQISPGAQNDSDPTNNSLTLDQAVIRKLDDVNPKNVPEEFLDPLVLALMEDPVVLPSSHRVDRAVIRKHICEFHADPFSGMYLTEDMLVSDDNLRTRIEEFISSSQGQGMQSTSKDALQTRTASYQSSPVAQNCSDPNSSKTTIPFEAFPMGFLDSLENYTLMKDPVILPSSLRRVDRAVIQNRISKLRVDPFSGRYLTEKMLVPDKYLKTRIEEFITELRSKNEQAISLKTKVEEVITQQ